MTPRHLFLSAFVAFSLSLAANAADGEDKITYTREVTFELTFAQSDLVWLGDPASPTAAVYPKPGAQPIATDACVTTVSSDPVSPPRRYYREARIADVDGTRTVYAFTSRREKVIGSVSGAGLFVPNDFYRDNRELLPSWPVDTSVLKYDAERSALYIDAEVPGPLVSETLDFLPLKLSDRDGEDVTGRFSIDFASKSSLTAPRSNAQNNDPTSRRIVRGANSDRAAVALTLNNNGEPITLATATLPSVFRGDDVAIGSFDNATGTYLPEAAYRAGARSDGAEPSVTVTLSGEFTSVVDAQSESLIVTKAVTGADSAVAVTPTRISIDGNFDDWRNTTGVDDPRGDLVPYLEYIPDVDLLELKVSHDDAHIYLYARVAGRVGCCHPDGGRSYFYAYMDVDRDPGTGFLPTRDDDCYFGVTIGDDCEVQFEFVDNRLLKTFYGFCGLGGNDNVLEQVVTLGKSQYGRFDPQGRERANYKAEYIYTGGETAITADLKPGTSDTIHLAVSPDGHEVEVVSTLTGFLKNPQGEPTVGLGQSIDVAAGMECDSKAYPGKTRWAADSTPAIRGYTLTPSHDTNR